MATARRFRDLWKRLGARGPWEPHYQKLVTLYLEPHRRYHTLDHVAYCLRRLDAHRSLASEPDEVQAALWWHDAYYDALRAGRPVRDNEERSAELANNALRTGGVAESRRSRIVSHILATKHSGAPLVGANVTLVVDIDMAILGERWAYYQPYALGVEREFRYSGELSELQYIRGRQSLFLEPMLARPVIFHTPEFSRRLDLRARQNMLDELGRLRNREKHLAA